MCRKRERNKIKEIGICENTHALQGCNMLIYSSSLPTSSSRKLSENPEISRSLARSSSERTFYALLLRQFRAFACPRHVSPMTRAMRVITRPSRLGTPSTLTERVWFRRSGASHRIHVIEKVLDAAPDLNRARVSASCLVSSSRLARLCLASSRLVSPSLRLVSFRFVSSRPASSRDDTTRLDSTRLASSCRSLTPHHASSSHGLVVVVSRHATPQLLFPLYTNHLPHHASPFLTITLPRLAIPIIPNAVPLCLDLFLSDSRRSFFAKSKMLHWRESYDKMIKPHRDRRPILVINKYIYIILARYHLHFLTPNRQYVFNSTHNDI